MNLLPPEPKIKIGTETIGLISRVESLCISISSILSTIPPDHPIIHLTKLNEAINSLSIDYPEINLSNKFRLEGDRNLTIKIEKYLEAVDLGLRLLKDVPRASHIIKSVHQKISGNTPERFRIHSSADFPDPEMIPELINDLDNYVLNDISYPSAINAALIHAQFESIRPFDELNGVTGRMLAQFHFIWKKKMSLPVFQLSSILRERKSEYFNLLGEIKTKKNIDDWILFFLKCLVDAGEKTLSILKRFLEIERQGIDTLIEKDSATSASLKLYKYFLLNPAASVPQITSALGMSKQTANLLILKFLEEKIIEEATGKQRYRVYMRKEIIDLFQ